MGDNTFYPKYINEYIRPKRGDRILDIGCGPADILKYLSDVDYTGIDSNVRYIQSAQQKYGSKGRFLCSAVGEDVLSADSRFDIIMANGVLHHLNDEDAGALFATAQQYLDPAGRLISYDGCRLEKQSLITRALFSFDRGKFIRTRDGYMRLVPPCFSTQVTIRHDLTFFPFTIIIIECRKPDEQSDSCVA